MIAIELRNDLSEIDRIQRLVEERAPEWALSPSSLNAINVSLDEVLTNIISYGYDDGAEHSIAIRVALETDGQVTIEVADDGKPFNPLETPEPDTDADIDDRPIGGLGIHLVLKLMDEVAYRRENDRNILTLKRRARK
jgi:anti-sigma regulatory factor (Ser/Thr protein kinase)